MKKIILIILTLILGLRSQTPFKTGINFPFYLNTVSINHYVNLVKSTGAKTMRQMIYADVHWKNVEPQNNQWNFSLSDSVFIYCNPPITSIGTLYSMMGDDTIGLQTPWLACNTPTLCYWDPAGDSIHSKDYIFQTVNKYKNYTKYWEVANEIESSLPPAGLPSILAKRDFLKYNYNWIKIADPQAKVILPGLVGTCCTYPMSISFTWLRNMLNVGAGSYFDIMNYHDYNSWWTLPAHYDSVKTILNSYGIGNKPIWVTETSISSVNLSTITPSYSSVDQQAADVWRRICLLWGKGAEVVMWHTLWSNNDMQGWGEFGLLSSQGSKKKSYHSYKLLNNKISNFSVVQLLQTGTINENNTSGGNGVWVVKFVVGGVNKWVIWSPNAQTYTLTGIQTPQIKTTTVVPVSLLNGGDSAVFNSGNFNVINNQYVFNNLTSIPILVEEHSPTALDDLTFTDNQITVFPNPAVKEFIVRLNSQISSEKISMEILDITGRIMKTNSYVIHLNNEEMSFTCEDWPRGFYIIRFNVKNHTFVKKLAVD
jgi:hypothetical protein